MGSRDGLMGKEPVPATARFLGATARHESLTCDGAADEVVRASRVEGLALVLRAAEHHGVRVTRL